MNEPEVTMQPKDNKEIKTPTFPRKQVIERQAERTRKVLELDTETLDLVRGGAARYGLPPTDYCDV
jgi:hypothetical protein